MTLTRKQKALLDFITRYVAENDGIGPTFDEMKAAVGLANKSGIHRLLSALEERGLIRRLHHRQRAIEVLPLAPPVSLASGRADIADRIIARARQRAAAYRHAGTQFGWADLRPVIIEVLGGGRP